MIRSMWLFATLVASSIGATGCGKSKGLGADDIAHLSVLGTPAEVTPRIAGADADGTRIYASFKKDAFFDQLQLDWNGSIGRAAPQWIALEATKKTTDEERARLSAVLHGGLLPGDAWLFGPIKIALKQNGSLEGTIDPKPGGTANPLFEKQSAAMVHVFAHAGFDAPLGISTDDMRDLFGGGYPVASLSKIDPTTPTSGAAAHVTSIFAGASPNNAHIEIAIDHSVASFLRLDWEDAPSGKLHQVVLTTSWSADHLAFDACISKKPLADGAKIAMTGNVGTLSAASTISKEAWSAFVVALDACR